MENVDNVIEVEFPDMTPEEKRFEFAKAQCSICYSELNIIYRAEQSLKNIVAKYWNSDGFQHYAQQMGVYHHLKQYAE